MIEATYDISMFLIVITLFILAQIAFIFLLLPIIQRRNQSHKKDIETLKADFEKYLLSTKIEMQEEIFHIVAAELHDNVGYSLSLAKLYLNAISKDLPDDIHKKIQDAIAFITKGIEDMRHISKVLHTNYVKENGITRVLEIEVERIKNLKIASVNYEVNGMGEFIDPDRELMLFRIVQEVLNNCIKHASAKTIDVTINYTTSYLEVKIIDDGVGFELSSANRSGKRGTGLLNITQRAEYIKSDCLIKSSPGNGTTVTIKTPY